MPIKPQITDALKNQEELDPDVGRMDVVPQDAPTGGNAQPIQEEKHAKTVDDKFGVLNKQARGFKHQYDTTTTSPGSTTEKSRRNYDVIENPSMRNLTPAPYFHPRIQYFYHFLTTFGTFSAKVKVKGAICEKSAMYAWRFFQTLSCLAAVGLSFWTVDMDYGFSETAFMPLLYTTLGGTALSCFWIMNRIDTRMSLLMQYFHDLNPSRKSETNKASTTTGVSPEKSKADPGHIDDPGMSTPDTPTNDPTSETADSDYPRCWMNYAMAFLTTTFFMHTIITAVFIYEAVGYVHLGFLAGGVYISMTFWYAINCSAVWIALLHIGLREIVHGFNVELEESDMTDAEALIQLSLKYRLIRSLGYQYNSCFENWHMGITGMLTAIGSILMFLIARADRAAWIYFACLAYTALFTVFLWLPCVRVNDASNETKMICARVVRGAVTGRTPLPQDCLDLVLIMREVALDHPPRIVSGRIFEITNTNIIAVLSAMFTTCLVMLQIPANNTNFKPEEAVEVTPKYFKYYG